MPGVCPACASDGSSLPVGESCAECGRTGEESSAAASSPLPPPSRRRSDFAIDSLRPKGDLAGATQDLFSLQSRPPLISITNDVEVIATSGQPDLGAPRNSQASLMFSLQELKRDVEPSEPDANAADQDLWEIQGASPLSASVDHDAFLAPAPDGASTSHGFAVPSLMAGADPRVLRLWISVGGACLALTGVAGWLLFADPGTVEPVAGAELPRAAANVDLAGNPPAPPGETLVRVAEERELPNPQPAEETAAGAAVAPSASEAPGATQDLAAPAELALGASAASPEPSDAPAPETKAPVAKKVETKVASRARKPVRRASNRSRKRVASTKSRSKSKAASAGAFDKGAAKRALVGAAKKAASCAKKGMAGGTGKVRVTFGTSGKVKSARITSARFAGSTTGKCAIGYFRGAKIPPFKGSPVTVAKSFTVR